MKRQSPTLVQGFINATCLALAAMLGLMFPGTIQTVQAQPPPIPPEVDTISEAPEETRARLRERLRLIRAWRLTEIIEMNEDTARQLFSLLEQYDDDLEERQRQLHQLSNQLRQHLELGTGDEAELSTLLEQIMNTHLQLEQLKVDLIRNTSSFLDARQRAVLMLFLPEFEREVRGVVQEFRRHRRSMREDDRATERGAREGRRERRRHQAEDPESPDRLEPDAPHPPWPR